MVKKLEQVNRVEQVFVTMVKVLSEEDQDRILAELYRANEILSNVAMMAVNMLHDNNLMYNGSIVSAQNARLILEEAITSCHGPECFNEERYLL